MASDPRTSRRDARQVAKAGGPFGSEAFKPAVTAAGRTALNQEGSQRLPKSKAGIGGQKKREREAG